MERPGLVDGTVDRGWLARTRRWLGGFLDAFAQREVPMRAVALAYYAFFSLFPLALLAVSVLGFLVRAGTPFAQGLEDQVTTGLTRVLTRAGGAVQNTVSGAFTDLGSNAASIGIVGLVGLVWGLSGSLNAIASAIGRIFDPRAPLPTWQDRLRSGRVILGIGGLFAVLNLTGLGLDLAAPLLPFSGLLVAGYRLVVQFLGPILTFGLFYRFLPTKPPSWREAALGAVVGGLLFSALQFGFSYYLRFVSYEGAFGKTLSAIAALFVWLNFSSLTFLLGALVAARLRPDDEGLKAEAEGVRGQKATASGD